MLEWTKNCLDVALQYKKEGRIRHLGFSTHADCRVIEDTIALGCLDYVNLHWYYIFQDNWPAIEKATAHDMGVFIISPNDKGGLLYKETARFAALTAPLHPMVFNGLFCLARPEVHTLSCGASKPEDFDIHLETAEKSDRAAEIVAPIVAQVDAAMEQALGRDWLATWQQGLPSWEETPGHINIPVVVRIWNLVQAFDMIEYGRMRYNLLGNGGHWFPGKNCEELAQHNLAVCLAQSPHREKVANILHEAHTLLSGEKRKRLQQEEAAN
jgi:predicted aldo/keto reductase-like oxidoreductase